MGQIKVVKGNIFKSNCMTLVNTVNAFGVMGAGIALEYRIRYPEMYLKYFEICKLELMDVGMLWIYKSDKKWILNFPTKKHWRYPSKLEYIESGLQKFCETYESKGITSIAFPLLGTDRGRLSKESVLELMQRYLSLCRIDVEIYEYKFCEVDEDLKNFINFLMSCPAGVLRLSKTRFNTLIKMKDYISTNEVLSFSDFLKINGVSLDFLIKLRASSVLT